MRILYLHGSWLSWENGCLTVSVRGKLQAAAGRLLAKDFDLIVLNTGMIWGKTSGSYAQVFQKELIAQSVDPKKILILENGHPLALDTSIEIESLWREIKKNPEWKTVTEVAFEEHLKGIKVIYKKLGFPPVDFRSTESIIASGGTAADKLLLAKIKSSPEEKMLRRYETLNILVIRLFGAKILRNFARDRNRPAPNVPPYLRLLFPHDIDIFQLPPKTK